MSLICKKCGIKLNENSKIEYCRKHRHNHYKVLSNCPTCGNERFTSKYGNISTTCRKCNNLGRKHSEEVNKKNSERNKGEGNGFYGKKHSEETRKKLGKFIRTPEHLTKSRENFKHNGNRKHPYDIWIKKYGIKIANQKELERRKKLSELSKGNKNKMFGKPSPIGSGNGWSGWFNNIYFRSLLELSYLKYLIDNNIKFESGELKKHKIEYITDDGIKNYFCDFYLIDSKSYIEIKPKKLLTSYKNKQKFEEATRKFGDKFKILTEDDIVKLKDEQIRYLYNTKELIWLLRYEEKFKERYLL